MGKVEEARGVIDRTDERVVENSQDWCFDVRSRLKSKGLLIEERGAKEWLMRRSWRGAYRPSSAVAIPSIRVTPST